ncbi:SRPBCC family protein [Fodinicola acaciae]|uniref:SRPBCC family protein n=1 Tax=Fodinicola acaciae TaxID=2681555 RepID=UPI0013D0A2B4|nr:SRPBCC family protein [Fodinicola acaciae]
MWTYEHSVETTAQPAAIWRLWADVAHWGDWNAEIEAVEIHGPFAEGTEIVMTPPGIRLTLAEVVENDRFVDEARVDGMVIRTMHRIGDGRVTYRMEISGPAGAQVGPQITADWPQTMAALVKLAENG